MEDTRRPKRCTRMGVYARSESFTPNDRTFGGRVAEESRLVIAGALPTAFISSSCCNLIVAIPPTTSIFLHYYYQQKLTTPCTSRPLSELTQLQALCGKENRTFVPPIDLNRPDVVSLKSRGRPIIRNVATTKKSLSSDSRSTAPSKVTNYHSNRPVRGPWPTTSTCCILYVWYAFLLTAFGQNSMSYRSYL